MNETPDRLQVKSKSGALSPRHSQSSANRSAIQYCLIYSTDKLLVLINPLKPNDPYRGRTAQLTSKRWILYIYSTNIGTEYFKHGIHSSFFLMQFVS